MKAKVISLVLILAIAMSSAVGITFVYKQIEEPEIHFAVLTDLHIKAESFYSDRESYDHYASIDKMIHLSEAIAKSIVDDLLKQKGLEAVFVAGDLTEDGDMISHYATRDILQRLVDNGIKVFVINGNHDITRRPESIGPKANAQEFRDVYWTMGYENAVERDDYSLSYSADVNDDYRLIAIDTDSYYSNDFGAKKENIDTRLIEWTETQVKKAVEDGKTPLAIAHHPLFNHWADAMEMVLQGIGHAPDPNAVALADILADNGCNYLFVGHIHGQSVYTHTNQEGNRLFQVMTASTVYLPASYRYVRFMKANTYIDSVFLQGLNMEYVSELETERDLIESDFRSYARQHLARGLMLSLNPQSAVARIGLPESMSALRELLEELLEGFINMPIYDSGDYISLQEIVEMYGGKQLRQSEYENMIEVIAFFVETVNSGDQSVSLDSVELEIVGQATKAIFYLLDQKSSELEEIYPESPIIDIDLDKLFSEGKLELLDSNILAFIYSLIREDLPSLLKNLNFNNLNNLSFLDMALPILLNDMLGNQVVESVLECVGERDINLEMFINDVLIGELLQEMLENAEPIDNFVKINKRTLEIIL